MRVVHGVAVLAVVIAGASCSDDTTSPVTSTSVPVTTAPGTSPPTTGPTTTAPVTTAPQTTAPDTTAPETTAVTTTTSEPATMVEVAVYFLRGERLVTEFREVPGPAVLRGALTELLAGPSGDEPDLVTAIPDGSELLDLALADGIARVDFNAQLGSGGGSLSMFARIAQVVFTATRFPNVDAVQFLVEGEITEEWGGEGLDLSEPQTRAMMSREITGAVIIDTPRPGDTVSSTFTVRGEGDVFEGDFPIEVWQDGELVGGEPIVFAGAWGLWDFFDVEITVDAEPGPIELRAYDETGCSEDEPGCTPIVMTVVPLTLAG